MHLESVDSYMSDVYESIFDNCVDCVKYFSCFFFVNFNFKISLEVFTHKANASICECFQWVCHGSHDRNKVLFFITSVGCLFLISYFVVIF